MIRHDIADTAFDAYIAATLLCRYDYAMPPFSPLLRRYCFISYAAADAAMPIAAEFMRAIE